MGTLILVWILLTAMLLWKHWKQRSLGTLLFAYFIGLSIIHVPGAMNYLGDARGLSMERETLVGFRATLLGMAALTFGALLYSRRNGTAETTSSAELVRKSIPQGYRLVAMGAFSFFVVLPLAGYLPSLTAPLSAMATLLIVGYWIILWNASTHRNNTETLAIALTLPVLPLATLATGGFIGYGVYWVISILAFQYFLSRRKLLWIVLTPFAFWFGLSIGVAYLEQRNAIRDAVWTKQASYGERIDRIFGIIDRFQLYNIGDPTQTYFVDLRLNQNYLVGKGIIAYEDGKVDLFYGATVPLWVFVPRAIWPEKPTIGGGRSVVSDFTGERFEKSTSVGVGQPLEFFANFAWPGLTLGFVLWGWILSRLDNGLEKAFKQGDLKGVLENGMPGLALLQPGGNLIEILVSYVSALVVSRALFKFLARTKLPLIGHDAM